MFSQFSISWFVSKLMLIIHQHFHYPCNIITKIILPKLSDNVVELYDIYKY